MRKLASQGALPFRVVRGGWGGKPSRGFDFAACVARWGDPDPDRLAMLEPGAQRVNQVDSRGGTAWKLYAPLPTIEAEDGGFARPFDRKDSARTDG